MLSRGNRILTQKEHACCVSGQMTAKERKYVTVMSVGFPGVILWHVICPKLCRALPEASHLTCLWPGIINHHLALLPQESDCCPPAFSEVMVKKGCSSCIWSNSVRLAILCTFTHLPLLFSHQSRASSQGFFSCPSVPCREFSVGAVGFRCLMARMYFVLSGGVTHGTVDCTFVRTDAWLNFSRDLVSLRPKTRQG